MAIDLGSIQVTVLEKGNFLFLGWHGHYLEKQDRILDAIGGCNLIGRCNFADTRRIRLEERHRGPASRSNGCS